MSLSMFCSGLNDHCPPHQRLPWWPSTRKQSKTHAVFSTNIHNRSLAAALTLGWRQRWSRWSFTRGPEWENFTLPSFCIWSLVLICLLLLARAGLLLIHREWLQSYNYRFWRNTIKKKKEAWIENADAFSLLYYYFYFSLGLLFAFCTSELLFLHAFVITSSLGK